MAKPVLSAKKREGARRTSFRFADGWGSHSFCWSLLGFTLEAFIYAQVVDEADEDALQVAARPVVGDLVDEKGIVRLGATEPVSGLAGAGVITGDGGYVVATDIVRAPNAGSMRRNGC